MDNHSPLTLFHPMMLPTIPFLPSFYPPEQFPPWANRYSGDFNQILSQELLDFSKYVELDSRELETRQIIELQVKQLVEATWKSLDEKLAKAYALIPFGSSATGLSLPGSDLDLVLVHNDLENHDRQDELDSLTVIADALRSSDFVLNQLVDLIPARVPILKFKHVSGVPVDLSFGRSNGIKAIAAVKNLQEQYPVLKPLVQVVKAFLRCRDMNEVSTGGLGGYGTTCLVAGFLSNYTNFFPNANNIQHPRPPHTTQHLGNLLIDFFTVFQPRCLPTFNPHTHGISLAGRQDAKPHLYFKLVRGFRDPQQPFLLSVEDPNDATNDVTKATYRSEEIRSEFGYAKETLELAKQERLDGNFWPPFVLGRILHLGFSREQEAEFTREWKRRQRSLSRNSRSPSPRYRRAKERSNSRDHRREDRRSLQDIREADRAREDLRREDRAREDSRRERSPRRKEWRDDRDLDRGRDGKERRRDSRDRRVDKDRRKDSRERSKERRRDSKERRMDSRDRRVDGKDGWRDRGESKERRRDQLDKERPRDRDSKERRRDSRDSKERRRDSRDSKDRRRDSRERDFKRRDSRERDVKRRDSRERDKVKRRDSRERDVKEKRRDSRERRDDRMERIRPPERRDSARDSERSDKSEKRMEKRDSTTTLSTLAKPEPRDIKSRLGSRVEEKTDIREEMEEKPRLDREKLAEARELKLEQRRLEGGDKEKINGDVKRKEKRAPRIQLYVPPQRKTGA
jgi:DNA polymerase sigma